MSTVCDRATGPGAASCIQALHALPDEVVGETGIGGQTIPLRRGHGLPSGAEMTGHIEAMAMYAGESVAAIQSVQPVAEVMRGLCAVAEPHG